MCSRGRGPWPVVVPTRALPLDGDSAPERDVPRDVLGRVLRRGIVPGRVLVHVGPDDDVVIARQPLPGAGRMGRAVGHVLTPDRVRREIHVVLDDLDAVTLREDRPVPRSLRHVHAPREWLVTYVRDPRGARAGTARTAPRRPE